MNITGYTNKGRMLIVSVAGQQREFVYPDDKFKTLEALEFEIQKSIDLEANNKVVHDQRKNQLEDELNARN